MITSTIPICLVGWDSMGWDGKWGSRDSRPFQVHYESVTISHIKFLFLVMVLEPSFLGMIKMHSVTGRQHLISHFTYKSIYILLHLFHIHHILSVFSFSTHIPHMPHVPQNIFYQLHHSFSLLTSSLNFSPATHTTTALYSVLSTVLLFTDVNITTHHLTLRTSVGRFFLSVPLAPQ